MKKAKLTEGIVRAAAQDEGNRHMRHGGRRKWSREDYNAAVRKFYALAKITLYNQVSHDGEYPHENLNRPGRPEMPQAGPVCSDEPGGNTTKGKNDEQNTNTHRRVLNDEGLYLWARSEGVDV